MTTRRHFLAIGSATTLLAAFLPTKLLKLGSARDAKSLADLHHDDFAALVNSHFTVGNRGQKSASLKLISAKPLNGTHDGKSFSLRFTGRPDQCLSQGIHRLRHDELQSLEVFLVPNHCDQQGQHYEVLFNRSA